MDFETREVAFDVVRAEPEGDGLTLEGYAAVFDSPTEIDSYEGNFIERIKPGAFKKTLRERTPVLMFNHGSHPLIGPMPIGQITKAREDARGLFVQARLASNWLIEPVREAIEQGAVNGMSFRFQAVKESWRDAARRGQPRERDVLEARVPELGPVVFPAYDKTSVGVRSAEVLEAISVGLADPEVRSDLARALVSLAPQEDLDTSVEAVREDTSEEAVTNDEPQQHSSITNALRVKARLASESLKETSNA